jgi:hypothetical protein
MPGKQVSDMRKYEDFPVRDRQQYIQSVRLYRVHCKETLLHSENENPEEPSPDPKPGCRACMQKMLRALHWSY